MAAVQQGVTDDMAALIVAAASDAARRTATHWSADPRREPHSWPAIPSCGRRPTDLADRDRERAPRLDAGIAADVAVTGATKRGVARGLSLGVNAGAVTIMLGTFAHTGGVTGAEVGIAAATAFLNQKLMNALFGEAAVQEMIDRAREGLTDRARRA